MWYIMSLNRIRMRWCPQMLKSSKIGAETETFRFILVGMKSDFRDMGTKGAHRGGKIVSAI